MSGEDRLLALPRFATDTGAFRPGLDRVLEMLSALGDPHLAFPAVHVAGTNGKGSTASMAASIADAAGLRVGLHTSPHLLTLRERMRVAGEPAPASWLDAAVRDLEGVLVQARPSFFEATLAIALAYFRDLEVDLAVVEVGLGGRLDATNVVAPVVSVVTHIGLDHTDLLGETLPEIAVEKAGIARPDVPLLHAVEDASARRALEAEAQRRGAPVEAVRASCRVDIADGRVALATPERDYGALEVGLPGAHQAWNAALAVRALEVASDRVGLEAVRAGVAEVATRSGLRGRAQSWPRDPRVVLDVAHNPAGWRAALEAVEVPPGGRLWTLVGVMADKDVGGLVESLAPRADRVLVVGLAGDRARPAPSLVAAFDGTGLEVEPVPSVADALEAFLSRARPNDRMLVTGSHQTVADALLVEHGQKNG